MEKIAVIGLGYVGLPVVVAFAGAQNDVVAYDINTLRVDELRDGYDRNGDFSSTVLGRHKDIFTSNPAKLVDANFYIIAVPTPIDSDNKPNLASDEHALNLDYAQSNDRELRPLPVLGHPE